MLSRIADSLYWMSRYLERVDSTARLVEINLLHLVEAEDAMGGAAEWRPLLTICGHESAYAAASSGREPSAARAIEFITRAKENPGSIRQSLRLARPVAPDYYGMLRSEVARFHGLTVSTMTRGEAFGFYLLGFFLERCDMTCRILDVKYHLLLPAGERVGSPLDYYQWAALLKSMSGFEAYRRKHPALRPENVAEFVILDPDFPRSLRFAVDRVQQALVSVSDVGARSPAVAEAMEIATLLEKHDARAVVATGLHEFLGEFLRRCSRLHEALEEEYFEAHLGARACAT
jgi:uncharacterized alpha-E superfamily protein